MYYASKLDKPIVSYIHSLEWDLVAKSMSQTNPFKKMARGLVKSTARFLYNKCDLLMVPSIEVAEILTWQQIRSKKVVVHLGTDTKHFTPPESREKAKIRLGIDPKSKVIGFCGRLAREKSLITLHRAFLRLQKKRRDVTLLIVGDGIREVRQLFENKPQMIFAGAQDDVVPYLQAMDIYVLPSLTETSSLSTMEAMACGCAVVSTPVGYVKDYIVEGYNGMFFPQTEAYLLSRKLEKLVEEPELIRKLGDNARKTIVAEYSWEKTNEEICKAIESVTRNA
jgi:glycosyltransferase involved in cell wall biosynthesis